MNDTRQTNHNKRSVEDRILEHASLTASLIMAITMVLLALSVPGEIAHAAESGMLDSSIVQSDQRADRQLEAMLMDLRRDQRVAQLLSTLEGDPKAGTKSSYPFCSASSIDVFRACLHDARDDFWLARAGCLNTADSAERSECMNEIHLELGEAYSECGEQLGARLNVCDDLGEAPYEPEIDPANFVDPLTIGSSTPAHPYLPLIPGYTRVYEAGDETVTVVVTHETIEIMGVTCIVVRDTVVEDGELVEDTDDWFAQDLDGNVWYFGELSRNYEDGRLVDLDGSFTAGEDGARAGLQFFAMPELGEIYRSEFALAEAEDLVEIISLTGTEATPAASCNGDCLVGRDFTPLEPDVDERKFYVAGIGMIVAYDLDEPEDREELVDFFFE